MKRLIVIFFAVMFTSPFCLPSTLHATPQTPMGIRYSEGILRKKATKSVMPKYPDEAQKKGIQGVAVAQLYVDEKGDVIKAEVLEAPDSSTKQAVAEATSQWKFTPSTMKGEPIRFRGKLTFYFVIEDGEARVENPKPVSKKPKKMLL